MNTEKPMNTEDIPQADDHDPAFDRRLGRLYQAALLDEKRQQQITEDFQALPEAGKALLKWRERGFVEDEPLLSAAMRDKLMAMLDTDKPKPKPIPWWKKLLSGGGGGWGSNLLPSGGTFAVPFASLAGLAVGVGVTVLFAPLLQPAAPQTRGDAAASVETDPKATASAQAITDAVRNDPAAWWAVIMALLQQSGTRAQGMDEMKSFTDRYPNYDSSAP